MKITITTMITTKRERKAPQARTSPVDHQLDVLGQVPRNLRHRVASLLRGDAVTEVARNLPENIQLVIHG
jgi:hypothetical protein